MSSRSFIDWLVSFDHWSWLFFFIWFAGSLGLNLAGIDKDGTLSLWGIILLLLCYHIRLVFVAEHFRVEGRHKLRLMTYLLLATLAISVAVQLLRQ